jgi:hypothetical protein
MCEAILEYKIGRSCSFDELPNLPILISLFLPTPPFHPLIKILSIFEHVTILYDRNGLGPPPLHSKNLIDHL